MRKKLKRAEERDEEAFTCFGLNYLHLRNEFLIEFALHKHLNSNTCKKQIITVSRTGADPNGD